MENALQRFLFEHANIRGELVSLDSSWQQVLERRMYPASVRKLLGEVTAATTLLAATIKLDGKLSIQITGHSALQLLLAETTGSTVFRSTAKWNQREEENLENVNLIKDGSIAVTITPKKSGQPYQGLVEVHGESVQESLENYMQQSEQLTTRLWLASNGKKASGMLLQKLPSEEDIESEDWNRIITLASTISEQELLALDFDTILQRLFHEETIRVFKENSVKFMCSCSEKRTDGMLESLGEQEIRSILKEQGNVNITCEFCGKNYIYSLSGVDRIFSRQSKVLIQDSNSSIN
ncbi:Hsp33 family molecular chaperone HslO [Burkholderiales bacterium]|nr:Hsp33 family molecular chaperone HslO [Burkholderiales bacterium]